MERPLLTIKCLVYNHAKYLKDALDGFINQKTNFKYDIYVYDDASTDGSSEILMDYAERYPELFRLYISPVNTYKTEGRRQLMHELDTKFITGKYVATCEGDDYWTDDNKLQIQVNYLESHPDTMLCCHASEWVDILKGTHTTFSLYDHDCDIPPEEIIAPVIRIPRTSSYVLRRELYLGARYGDFPKADSSDLATLIYSSMRGKIHYIDRVMSVYRCCTEGSWSARTLGSNREFLKSTLIVFNFLEECYRLSGNYKAAYVERLNRKLYYSAWHESNLSYDKWEGVCQEVIKELGDKYAIYVDKLRVVHHIYREGSGLTLDEMAMLKGCENILIFGTGDYSGGAFNVIKNHNLQERFIGYLVSKKTSEVYNEKPIWSIYDYPFNRENTGIIVGVGLTLRKEVGRLLEDNFYHYVAPFWKDYWGDII